jgi:L-asparaginase
MVPHDQEKSDALFNLGCAITAVQSLPNGVYITMNGKIFTWDNVIKNKALGLFETLEKK